MEAGLQEFSELRNIGVYISPPGGAPEPGLIHQDRVCVELLIDGAVYGFEPDPVLHPVGTVFVHHAGDHTISRTKGQGHYACFHFTCALNGVSPAATWPRSFFWEDLVGMRKFADEMLRAYHDSSIDKGVINQLLWSQFRFRMEQDRENLARRQMPSNVVSTIAYIESRFAEDLSVEFLAERASMSASHLQATFRQHVGKTIHQYLIEIRMSAAVHALLTTDSPIKSVALEAGYANTENFCRAFKKKYGLTAASYRSKYRRYEFT